MSVRPTLVFGLFTAPFVGLAAPLHAQTRDILITEDADYFGGDYDIRKDVSLEECKQACPSDDQCKAFTYNVSSSWCFLKEGDGSGRVNAYLAADETAERANALALVAAMLGRREDWKPALRAFRASLDLDDDPAVRLAYEKAAEKHGFRIAGHRIETEGNVPRICLTFSDPVGTSETELGNFISLEGPSRQALSLNGQEACFSGVEFGGDYQVTARSGIASEDGMAMIKTARIELRVGDREASIRFPGTAYVLPGKGEATIPVITINTSHIEAELYRIGDREIARPISGNDFLRQLDGYDTDRIRERTGQRVWKGTVEIKGKLNEEVTSAIPVGELERELKPGIYILVAGSAGNQNYWGIAGNAVVRAHRSRPDRPDRGRRTQRHPPQEDRRQRLGGCRARRPGAHRDSRQVGRLRACRRGRRRHAAGKSRLPRRLIRCAEDARDA